MSLLLLFNQNLRAAYTLTAAVGAFALTGNDANITVQRKVAATTQTYVLTEISAGLIETHNITVADGVFELTGSDANLYLSRQLSANNGTFALNGNDIVTLVSRVLSVESGEFVLTGNIAAVGNEIILRAGTGTFTLNGNDAGLIALSNVVIGGKHSSPYIEDAGEKKWRESQKERERIFKDEEDLIYILKIFCQLEG